MEALDRANRDAICEAAKMAIICDRVCHLPALSRNAGMLREPNHVTPSSSRDLDPVVRLTTGSAQIAV
jgi:hypothetical protein